MAETIRLRVEVEDDSIIVTLPGTTFRVIYRKPSQYPGLVAFDLRGDKSAGVSQANFMVVTHQCNGEGKAHHKYGSTPAVSSEQHRPIFASVPFCRRGPATLHHCADERDSREEDGGTKVRHGGRTFFCEQCVAGHSQPGHFDAKRDFAGWPLYSWGESGDHRKTLIMIWKRPQDDTTGAVSFCYPPAISSARRFPPPWTVEQIPGGYKVKDASGQSLAYVYGRETRADADIANVSAVLFS